MLLLGFGRWSNREKESEDTVTAGPSSAVIALASVFAFLFILRLARFTYAFDADMTRLVVASAVVPMLLPIVYVLVRRNWRYLQGG